MAVREDLNDFTKRGALEGILIGGADAGIHKGLGGSRIGFGLDFNKVDPESGTLPLEDRGAWRGAREKLGQNHSIGEDINILAVIESQQDLGSDSPVLRGNCSKKEHEKKKKKKKKWKQKQKNP